MLNVLNGEKPEQRKNKYTYSIELMALHRDRSQTGCWKNNYWMPVGSSDVNKSGLVPQLSDSIPQRKIRPQVVTVYCKKCNLNSFYLVWSPKNHISLQTTGKNRNFVARGSLNYYIYSQIAGGDECLKSSCNFVGWEKQQKFFSIWK